MSPFVSVIIPAYNSERFIAETLESVICQTFADLEVLVVDDGSEDPLRRVVDEFVARDSRIRYIRQANRGVAAARNNGFKQSRGRFIAFLDSDDVWLPENLAVKLKRFEQDDVGLVHSDAVLINEHSQEMDTVLTGREGDVLDGLLLWDGTQIPGPSSVLVKREVLNVVGMFDERMSTSADFDLFIRIAARFQVARVNQITWRYRIHGANMHKNIRAMEADLLLVYAKARQMRLFKTSAFERRCFSTALVILAASWAGDGKNASRAAFFVLMAIKIRPFVIFNLVARTFRWILK